MSLPAGTGRKAKWWSTDEIEAKLLELWEKYSYQPETVEELFHPELNRKFKK